MSRLQRIFLGKANALSQTITPFVCLIVSLCFFTTCEVFKRPERLIEDIDMIEMANTLLPDFQLVRERPRDTIKTDFVFSRDIDSADVHITVGIFSTSNDAEDHATEYLSLISLYMYEGPHQEVLIGDRYWWWEQSSSSNDLRNIVFVRRNALFIMSCSHKYHELKSLAKKIDDGILNRDSYVSFRK